LPGRWLKPNGNEVDRIFRSTIETLIKQDLTHWSDNEVKRCKTEFTAVWLQPTEK
jgi:hypothetical protein